MADMNITPARDGLTPEIWQKRFYTEYVRANQFAPYFGKSINAMIQVNEDLSKTEGDRITFPAVRRLVGAGVTGNQILEGNEELIDARSMSVVITYFAHAVSQSKWDRQKSVIDILEAGKDALQVWALEKIRADIIFAFGNITGDDNFSVSYASATATQRNYWLANNSDRVQFGQNVSTNTGTFSTSLAAVNPGTTGKVTGAALSTAKRRAKNANPRIRPLQVKNGSRGGIEEWFVVFLNSYQFRDFLQDPAVQDAQKYAAARGDGNPLFTGGDLYWDGMWVREIPELNILSGVGASSSDVGPAYLCGAQSLGIAWAQKTQVLSNVRDYGRMKGVGVDEMRGVDKLRFGRDPTNDQVAPVDQGIYTMFFSSTADA